MCVRERESVESSLCVITWLGKSSMCTLYAVVTGVWSFRSMEEDSHDGRH
eukprot:COSAG03_NODE_2912_length_2359_cov_2.132743_3_plen_50_part_00